MLPSDRPQAGAAIQGPAAGLHSLASPVCRSAAADAEASVAICLKPACIDDSSATTCPLPQRYPPGRGMPRVNMEVLAWGDEKMLIRPCVDCGLMTGRYCDWCRAADRCPNEQWAKGQMAPLCSYCDNMLDACHFCRGLSWCAPPPTAKHHSTKATASAEPFPQPLPSAPAVMWDAPTVIIDFRLIERNLVQLTATFEMRNWMRETLVSEITVPLQTLPPWVRICGTTSLSTCIAMLI